MNHLSCGLNQMTSLRDGRMCIYMKIKGREFNMGDSECESVLFVSVWLGMTNSTTPKLMVGNKHGVGYLFLSLSLIYLLSPYEITLKMAIWCAGFCSTWW